MSASVHKSGGRRGKIAREMTQMSAVESRRSRNLAHVWMTERDWGKHADYHVAAEIGARHTNFPCLVHLTLCSQCGPCLRPVLRVLRTNQSRKEVGKEINQLRSTCSRESQIEWQYVTTESANPTKQTPRITKNTKTNRIGPRKAKCLTIHSPANKMKISKGRGGNKAIVCHSRV